MWSSTSPSLSKHIIPNPFPRLTNNSAVLARLLKKPFTNFQKDKTLVRFFFEEKTISKGYLFSGIFSAKLKLM
jgi:hypothetical protein